MIRRTAIALTLVTLGFLPSCAYRLTPYENITVGKPAVEVPAPVGEEIQITYLGTNGYIFRSSNTTIVVDPYLSRIDTRSILFNADVSPSPSIVADSIQKAALHQKVDGFLVTHAHFDHLFDVSPLQQRLGGKVVTSQTGAYLCEAAGVSRRQLLPSKPGKIYRIGDAKVRVLEARHDKILGSAPYPGNITEPLGRAPRKPKDWRMGEPLAFLIELNGKRIYVESGGIPGHTPSVSDVDLAIIGVALPGSQRRYADAVVALNPRYVLPSHQDNFFHPLKSGFQFSAVADFPRILATHEAKDLPGRLILMKYFHSWSLD